MLSEAITHYIQLYRDMGFKYKVQEYMLRSFGDFAGSRSEDFIRTETVLEWASSAPSLRQRHDRLLTIRRLARALNAEDQRHQVPPSGVFGRAPRKRRTCRILTLDEVDRLLRAASQLTPRGSIRPMTYTTLLSLIACTGLRISEALKLELSDITEDGLLIRATKFQKSRLVPLHESARRGLERISPFATESGQLHPLCLFPSEALVSPIRRLTGPSYIWRALPDCGQVQG